SHRQGLDRPGDVFGRRAPQPDLLAGQPALVQQLEHVVVPANRRHHVLANLAPPTPRAPAPRAPRAHAPAPAPRGRPARGPKAIQYDRRVVRRSEAVRGVSLRRLLGWRRPLIVVAALLA